MVITHLEKRLGRGQRIVFTIPLPGRKPVFMSMNIAESGRESFGIVIVDAQKFLDLWRADPHDLHRAEANGTPDSWPNDYKYRHAFEGFSQGQDNPVPLAHVSYQAASRTIVSYRFLCFGKKERQEKLEYVSFTNGITRTIWLLSQGCTAFPVMCNMPGAHGLFLAAGAEGTSLHPLS